MIAEIRTVAWKEWKELFAGRGRLRGGVANLLLILGVFGVVLPWQIGRAWIHSPTVLLSWVWMPLFLVSNVVVDAIAGERERHTLETLLATRLSDRAILLGKLGAAIAYGCLVLVGCLALGVVTATLLYGDGRLLLYPPSVLLGSVVVGLLGATLIATTGALVSLRAGSTRQAGQAMGITIMLLLFAPLLAFRALGSLWKTGAPWRLPAPVLLAFVALGGLVLLDAVLLGAALTRFRRSRLSDDGALGT